MPAALINFSPVQAIILTMASGRIQEQAGGRKDEKPLRKENGFE